jgi:glycosyltransferase involved in cell wall biosynthesis
MKVLIVTQYFWPESFPITDLVKSLIEKGIEVEVLTGKPNYPGGAIYPGYRAWGCRRESLFGATVHRIPLRPRGVQSGIGLALNYLSFVFSGLLIAPWFLRGRRYDAIFVYAPSPILQAIPALFLGWLKRCKVIVWVQDLWPDSLAATGYVRSRPILLLVKAVVRFIYRRTDLLLAQSRAFVARISALAPGKDVRYYPNSVDAILSRPPGDAGLPDIAGLEAGFPVVFAGNLGFAQAVEVIVEAAALLKDHHEISFVVAGDGSRREWMQQQKTLRGLDNLHLPGRFPIQTMPALMRSASALLVTLADQPIFAATIPSKVQAYLAAGRPIIASLNGEGAQLVNAADAGLAVPAQDAPALAEAVLRMLRMTPTERETLGANGRRYFDRHFDHDLLVGELIGMIEELTATGRRFQ